MKRSNNKSEMKSEISKLTDLYENLRTCDDVISLFRNDLLKFDVDSKFNFVMELGLSRLSMNIFEILYFINAATPLIENDDNLELRQLSIKQVDFLKFKALMNKGRY